MAAYMDTTQASAILKEDLTSPLVDLVRTGAYLFRLFIVTAKDTQGSDIKKPVTLGHPQGLGAGTETGATPTAVPSSFAAATFAPTTQRATLRTTEKAILVSRNDRGAFTELLSHDMRGILLEMKKDYARQLWGDATGQLTVCNTTTATTVVNVCNTNFLDEGMLVDIRVASTGATSTGGAALEITAVDPDAGTVTLSTTAVTTDRTFSIYRPGARNIEMWGLQAAISASNPGVGNYGNINRTTTRRWRAQSFLNSGVNRALTVDLFDQAMDEVLKHGRVSDALTNLALRRKFWALFREDRRFNGEGPLTVDGGYDVLKFRGARIYADPDCILCGATSSQLNRFYLIDKDTFSVDQLKDIGWLEADGAVLKHVSGTLIYEAIASWYAQFCCSNPQANGVLGDITE